MLLRAIAGLLPPRTFTLGGSMRVHGLAAYANGRKARRRTWARVMARGLVFVPAESAQAMNPALTLEHNRRLLAPDAHDAIARRLRTYFDLDFGAFARLYPDEVSGGELQRITLMILLSRRGDLVLLDEPTVNLDRTLRRRFVDFLNDEVLSDLRKTVVMASHDLDFIQSLKLDDAYGLEGGRLVHLDAVPRAAGFRKAERRNPAAPASSLEGVSQSYFKRGIFGERTFPAFTRALPPVRPLDDLRHHRPLRLRQVEHDQGHPAPRRRDDGEHHARRPGPGRAEAARARRRPARVRSLPAQDGGRPAGLALRLLPRPAHPRFPAADRDLARRCRELRPRRASRSCWRRWG